VECLTEWEAVSHRLCDEIERLTSDANLLTRELTASSLSYLSVIFDIDVSYFPRKKACV